MGESENGALSSDDSRRLRPENEELRGDSSLDVDDGPDDSESSIIGYSAAGGASPAASSPLYSESCAEGREM